MATKTREAALANIADLAKGLADAAEDQTKRNKLVDGILDEIGSLDKDDAKALFRDERVQALIEAVTEERAESSDDRPGTIYAGMIGSTPVKGFTKKAWTESDLRKEVEKGHATIVRYTPRSTQPVIWNGLVRQFVEDEPMWVEDTFIGIYEESLFATKAAADHAQWLMRKRDTLRDPSMVTPNGAKARATGSSGWYVPGGGMIAGRGEEGGTGEQAAG